MSRSSRTALAFVLGTIPWWDVLFELLPTGFNDTLAVSLGILSGPIAINFLLAENALSMPTVFGRFHHILVLAANALLAGVQCVRYTGMNLRLESLGEVVSQSREFDFKFMAFVYFAIFAFELFAVGLQVVPKNCDIVK